MAHEFERATLQRILNEVDSLDEYSAISFYLLLELLQTVRKIAVELQDHLGGPVGE